MKNNVIKKSIALIITAASLFAFTACSGKTAPTTPSSTPTESETPVALETPATVEMSASMKKIKERGVLVLGTSAGFPPYEFHKSINGKDEIVGFDIEIAKEIAKDLGVTLEIKDMDFKGLLAALDQGVIDIIIAGMSPTEERAKSVDFSKIYYQSEQSLVIRAKDKELFKTNADLTGKNIGVQMASIQESIAAKQFSTATPLALAKIQDLFLSLKSSRVDAILIENTVAVANVNANPDLFVTDIEIPVETKGAAAALKKNSPDLVKAVNETLDKLIAAGQIDKFVADATALLEAE